jgi:hypothetical protein
MDVEVELQAAMREHTEDLVADPLLLSRLSRPGGRRLRPLPLLAAAASVVAIALLLSLTGSLRPSGLGSYESDRGSQGAAVGISPPFVPQTGRDWIQTRAQSDSFYRTHAVPSPGPVLESVQRQSGPDLLADVSAASLPGGATIGQPTAAPGDYGAVALQVLLPGNVPVEVTRRQSTFPGVARGAGEVVDAVPGTAASAAVVMPFFGYAFPPGTPGDVDANSDGNPDANAVSVITRAGVETFWVAPSSVDMDDLRSWAFAAAAHQG